MRFDKSKILSLYLLEHQTMKTLKQENKFHASFFIFLKILYYKTMRNQNNKEIELRAEISPLDLQNIENKFSNLSLVSSEKRLSVLFLGSVGNKNIDIRIRTSSKKYTELVLKIGEFHSHDRTEITQKINPKQFMGFVNIFSKFGFSAKVMYRETKRLFSEKEGYEIAIVDAKKYAYVEIEKVIETDDEILINQEKNNLEKIINSAGMTAINKEQFDNLCDRLTSEVDWEFSGSDSDYLRLESELSELL